MNIFMQMYRIRPRLRKLPRVLNTGEIEEGHFLPKKKKGKLWVSQHAKWMEGTVCLLEIVWWDICALVSRDKCFLLRG